jgi:secreted trypsin-like serine protease
VINIGGKWIISGIVSGALNECGKAGNPGVYTKVSSFNNWIKEAIYSSNENKIVEFKFQSVDSIARQICASDVRTVSRTLTNLLASTNTI